jgi:recombination protein RecR
MAIMPLPFERLVRALAKMPGLGPRSAQRMALYLLTHTGLIDDTVRLLTDVAGQLCVCSRCGNLGLAMECHICTDTTRDASVLCVVEGVDDLWAMERAGVYKGRYHVLGGVVSALDNVGPEKLRIESLLARVMAEGVAEVILGLGASVDGQTTGHIIIQRLKHSVPQVVVSSLAKGMPVGAEVDYLDEGTLGLALQGRLRVA